MTASTPTLARTATCRTCGKPIVLDTSKRPGERPTTAWSDGMSSQPTVCFAAISLRHEPGADS